MGNFTSVKLAGAALGIGAVAGAVGGTAGFRAVDLTTDFDGDVRHAKAIRTAAVIAVCAGLVPTAAALVLGRGMASARLPIAIGAAVGGAAAAVAGAAQLHLNRTDRVVRDHRARGDLMPTDRQADQFFWGLNQADQGNEEVLTRLEHPLEAFIEQRATGGTSVGQVTREQTRSVVRFFDADHNGWMAPAEMGAWGDSIKAWAEAGGARPN